MLMQMRMIINNIPSKTTLAVPWKVERWR